MTDIVTTDEPKTEVEAASDTVQLAQFRARVEQQAEQTDVNNIIARAAFQVLTGTVTIIEPLLDAMVQLHEHNALKSKSAQINAQAEIERRGKK